MFLIKALQKLLVSYPSDLKIVCNNNQIVQSHKILFGLLHVSLEEIFSQDDFTNQMVTIYLPMGSEELKKALDFTSLEDSMNLINNIYKTKSSPEPSKPVHDDSPVKLESIEMEDFASEYISETVEDSEDFLPKSDGLHPIMDESLDIKKEEKKVVKKVKLSELLNPIPPGSGKILPVRL